MQPAARWQDTLASMRAPLEVEDRLAAAPPPSARPDWVFDTCLHGTRGLLHLSLFGAGLAPPGSYLTRCGWDYSGVTTIRVTAVQPQLGEYKRVCKTCAPAVRRRLRDDLIAGVVLAAPPDFGE